MWYLIIAMLTVACGIAQAQRVDYIGRLRTVGPEGGTPYGVAVDQLGNVYIVDTRYFTVTKVPPSDPTCSKGTCSSLAGGLNDSLFGPDGVAVDTQGNVYIADTNNSRVVKVPPGDPTCSSGQCTAVGSGLNQPVAVATDRFGTVYIADTNNSRVQAVPPSDPTCSNGQCYDVVPQPAPTGVTVDADRNVYAATPLFQEVIVARPGDSDCSEVAICPKIGSGFSMPTGVAVDDLGAIYISDYTKGVVVKVLLSDPGCSTPGDCATFIAGLYQPFGMAADSKGNVYVADSGNGRVLWMDPAPVDFGSVNVCPGGQTAPAPCSQTLTLNYSATASGTLGTPLALTEGVRDLDFTVASGSTCSGAITAGAQCVVNVTFAPRSPGVRNGAIEIVDDNGTVLASTYIYGSGASPAAAFNSSAPPVTLGSGFVAPNGVAVDYAGDVFVADTNNNAVKEIVAVNGSIPVNPTILTLSSGFNSPTDVAVDGAANVFVTERGYGGLKEIVAVNGSIPANPTIVTLSNEFDAPEGVAVDGAGDVFIADSGNGEVKEIFAQNGRIPANPTIRTLASGLPSPTGLAIDSSGNVFVAELFSDTINEIVAVNGSIPANPTILTLGSGFALPFGVAVDSAGDVFVTEALSATMKEIVAVNGSIPADPTVLTLGSGFSSLLGGVALDSAGNVILADNGNNAVKLIVRSQPPSLSFAATAVGSTSSDSPLSIQVQNIGNQPLVAIKPGLSVGANFQQVKGPGTLQDCTRDFSLDPGELCNLSLSFMPAVGGEISTSAVLTDNSLNIQRATQMVALSGKGIGLGSQTIIFNAIPSQSVETKINLVATASSGLAVSFASTTQSVCTVSGTQASLLAAGTCSITASQAGNSQYEPAPPIVRSFMVTPAAQTITFNTIPAQTVGTVLNLVATASSGLPVSFASTTPGVCTVSGSKVSSIAVGYCTIIAAQAGDSQYAPAAPVKQSFAVGQATQTITFDAIPAQTVGTVLNLVATASSGLPVSFASTRPSVCAVSGTQATMLTAGACGIIASQNGNSQYPPAIPVARDFAVLGKAQVITFNPITPQVAGTTINLVATASSGLPVSFASTRPSVCTVSGSRASLLIPGTCGIIASQSGNSLYGPALPVARDFAVNLVSKPSTQTITRVQLSASSIILGQRLKVTAIVTDNNAAKSPVNGGRVEFFSDDKSIGYGTVVDGGTFVIISSLPLGHHLISASYKGCGEHAPSKSSARSVKVDRIPTMIALKVSPEISVVGQPVKLTATVSAYSGYAPPDGGEICFFDHDGATKIGHAKVLSGKQTYVVTISTLKEGRHKLTAHFRDTGDGNYDGSRSKVETLTISSP